MRNPSRRILRSLPAVVAFLIAAAYTGFTALQQSKPQVLRVAQVVDGDTVIFNNGRHGRYLGIDTPETHRKVGGKWVSAADAYGRQATEANEELVLGKAVRCEFDVVPRDKYNRDLVYCFVKENDREVMVQEELLRRGLAYLYTFPPNVKYTDALVRALEEAKSARRGMWSQDLVIPSTSAKQHLNQRRIVSGRVTKTRSTEKTVQLFMDGLRVVIFARDLDAFLNKGIDPHDVYRGKDLQVFGLIKDYQGHPEIIVSHPAQIDVMA